MTSHPTHSGPVEGRWLLHLTTHPFGSTRVDGPGGHGVVPVVPCDDDAVERVAERLYYIDDERVRVDGVEWVNEPDGYKGLWRDRARDALRAAGETSCRP